MNTKRLNTLNELAKAIGRHPGTISRWTRRDDWPVRRRGPWPAADLRRIREWMRELREDRNADPEPDSELGRLRTERRRREVALLGRRVAKLGIEVERARGELLPLGETAARFGRLGAALGAKLCELETLAPLLAGRTEAEISAKLAAWGRDTLCWFKSQSRQVSE